VSPKSKVQSPRSKTKDQRPKIKIAIVCLFATFALLACTNDEATKRSFVIAESKSYEASLFRQNCAICHGAEAQGKEIDGKLIPSLRYGEAANKSEEEIRQQIQHGKLPMPSFQNQLTADEIERMVKFIRHDLQGKE
jgi:mono/diheme cytochrome c family protein